MHVGSDAYSIATGRPHGVNQARLQRRQSVAATLHRRPGHPDRHRQATPPAPTERLRTPASPPPQPARSTVTPSPKASRPLPVLASSPAGPYSITPTATRSQPLATTTSSTTPRYSHHRLKPPLTVTGANCQLSPTARLTTAFSATGSADRWPASASPSPLP